MQTFEAGVDGSAEGGESLAVAYARDFTSGGERAAYVIDLLKARCEETLDNFILMQVVYTLDHHQRVAFFECFTETSSCRVLALSELIKSCAWTGRPDKAIMYASQLKEQQPLSPETICFLATQYARIGCFADARSLLRLASSQDNSLSQEFDIGFEFFQFLEAFDYSSVLAMYEDVRKKFMPDSTVGQIECDIRNALETKTPYLLLRMGDGEGACIRLDQEDELINRCYYSANRREFLKIWFEDESVIDDPDFQEAINTFNQAIGHANCLGGIYREAIDTEFALGSRRGIAWVANVLRKILYLARVSPIWAQNTRICHLGIHYDLVLSGALARLLNEQSSIGLISCHDRLPDALARTYGLDHIEFYKIPGEQAHGAILGQRAVEGSHWPERYNELCRILDEPRDRRGQLFLVAAGLLGKIYAWKLMQAGAVVIDIGAVADLWMQKHTRVFPQLPANVRLALDEQIVLVDIGGLGGLQEVWRPHLDRIFPVVFEPNEREAQSLRATLAGNGLVLTTALGGEAATKTLNITKSLGCTSLLTPNNEFLMGYSILPAFDIVEQSIVTCTRYDALFREGKVPTPDLIKIDTQGFEFEVLIGFGDLLHTVLAVQLEAHLYAIYEGQKLLQDIVSLLQQYGLVVRRLAPVDHFDGDIVEVDVWFTCDQERLAELSSVEHAKLSFIERVWQLPERRRSFGLGQFA